MLKYRAILFYALFFITFDLGARDILPPTVKAPKSFAIVIDYATFEACQTNVLKYQALLAKEGLAAYILMDNWNNPQDIKDQLITLYTNNALEGALLIGEIPIPMIRDAQHLTSAFKMDQRTNRRESSVPSDRFYDDFDLKFDYLGQDDPDELFHYYSLRFDSPQYIECDIYSGRIKPTKAGASGYAQINAYFEKLFIERTQKNPLDVIVSYAGDGSFSNSLTAWKEEPVTLREQIPQSFTNANSAKFFVFYMADYMKDILTQELRRPDVDLMIFHEHGMPERQYLTGEPFTYLDQYKESIMRYYRSLLRRYQDRNANLDSLMNVWKAQYHFNDSWFANALTREMFVADSLEDLQRGIILEDVPEIAPNPRLVIFDACFNADFREDSFIAGEYIFAAGKTVVCFGNSVNVLQDKSSNDLLGMLGYGYRVGQWAQMTNILESHIIGDPTMRFASPAGMVLPDLDNNRFDYWLDLAQNKDNPVDIRGLALHTLHRLHAPDLSDLLRHIYDDSDQYMLRLYCFQLMQYYGDQNFAELLHQSIHDPYEFIRRRTAKFMGNTGDPAYIPALVQTWLRDDDFDERVGFNCSMAFDLLNKDEIRKEAQKQIEGLILFDKEKEMKKVEDRILSRSTIRDESYALADTTQKMSSRIWGVQVLRNNNYLEPLDSYLQMLKDNRDDLGLRISLAEALGWYIHSKRKTDIIQTCREVSYDNQTDQRLKNELLKTANRLETYMRFNSRFGIVIDRATYQAAKSEVDAYKAQLESEGLGAFVMVGDWVNPMELRAELIAQTKTKPILEGVVFIGEIPIAKVHNAQHLTTAFKMDEQRYPMNESAVATDRFYDNIHLQWELIAQDSTDHSIFYYRLKESSPQHLDAAFYSARIKPPTDRGEDPQESIKKFLTKVVRKHQEINPLDKFVVFNGSYYNSDCLTAWNNEPFALKEQFPECFRTHDGNGFYNFRQGVAPKYQLFNKMQEKGIDLFLFHEHGSFNIQHISSDYQAFNIFDKLRAVGASVRNRYRSYLMHNPQSAESFKEQCMEDDDYGFLEVMFSDSVLMATRYADSLLGIGHNMVLEDLAQLKPQATFTLFDACYNGSFNEAKKGYVAGYHLFGDGETIVTQGNTVNVLQDKWSIELIGMLAQGARIGFWHNEVLTLECHLNGDPTYFFSAPKAKQFNRDLAVNSDNANVWTSYFQSDNPTYQAIALKKMGKRPDKAYSDLLLHIYRTSPFYSVRMEAMQRLLDIKDNNMITALVLAFADPYELIRRNAARFAGYTGDERFIAPLISTTVDNNESKRVQYAAQNSLIVFDKEKNNEAIQIIANKSATDEKRISQIRSLRNYNRHSIVPELIEVLKDASEKDEIRVSIAEALGWYAWSIDRPELIRALEEVRDDPASSQALRDECMQSVIRIE